MSEPLKTRLATDLIHAGRIRTNLEENGEALFLTSGFTYESAEMAESVFANQADHYQYSRFANPTVTMLQDCLAKIDGAEACRATATGMAAVHAAVMCGIKAGDRVVASRALFGSCHWIISTLLPQYGIESVFVDGGDLEGWKAALSQPAALVLLESPSNPMLDIVDLRAVSALAHEAGAIVVVDNVFATPLLQKPLELGADVVVYSATKHMDGQGRVLGGAVLSSKKWIEEVFQPFFRNTGPSISPFNAWVILKGLETMQLRVKAQSENAEVVARFLEGHPKIQRALYPTLDSFKQRELAMSQMSGGGTLVAFELKGSKAEAFRMMNAFRIITISNNLGDTKSLATHPATTTHMKIGPGERAKLGITDGTIRLSVGLEDARDLIEDLTQALDQV
ncbi:O-succinylhomoserine sulfhydrylase [Acidocella aminolytica]|uniref:O-succinylhomoserine sulfhydrylase n=1 Tax=Acidocella aminolytica 101 = DSM 11237 TaxID=1120923 RepID=A0A0D6PHV1_9PROT|nr:O-succinylhomoserine sulfhydrylase [Acidocella aminolytica]GAN81227.1 O-succinylhomoserine sulfhydrylase [Acidocella aminolytica 101 = DSM 11237]GBQ31938.1 O-succinylhomoserine sulfhydrylase [Acidocella aminolytica 101 = DSM 11237]SHE84920.1 O-succinylhomoserine sulfhydrylase [Acidocella aminolytica 101 = DSM 11237]